MWKTHHLPRQARDTKRRNRLKDKARQARLKAKERPLTLCCRVCFLCFGVLFCFVPAGISLAQSSGNATLQRECASILEGMRQWQDAAMLYETAGAFEKAVRLVCVYSVLLTLLPPLLSAVCVEIFCCSGSLFFS